MSYLWMTVAENIHCNAQICGRVTIYLSAACLLESISVQDLKETDLDIYRVSTGDRQLNADSACTSSASPISIKPGSRIQLLKLGDNCDLGTEHYYVYVCGHNRADAAQDKCFDFDNTNAIGRPQYYVPVKVPFYDEVASRQQYNAYRYGKEDGVIADSAEAPEAIYRWHYRPEMQFSVFDLDVAQVNAVKDQEGGSEDIIDLLTQETPVLGSDADYAQLLFDLLINEGAPLDSFGPDRELVFAIGEDEVLATFGEDQTLQFANLDHLGSLQPEDFLSIRLYANHDAANVLWEWSFLGISLFPPKADSEPYEISADDASDFALSGVFLGDVEEGVRVSWHSEPAMTFGQQSQLSDSIYFANSVNLPTQAETAVNIRVETSVASTASFHPLKIVAGAPRNFASLSTQGKTAIGGFGTLTIEARVTDQFGNPVQDGTPVTLNAEFLVGDFNQQTTGGMVSFAVQGAEVSGDHVVEVSTGAISVQTTLHVHDIELEITIPDIIRIGDEVPVTVNATSSYGDLTGFPIHLSSVRATLPSDWVTLQGNSVDFLSTVGEFRGEGAFYAAIGDTITFKEFNVIEEESIYLLDNVLVAGGAGTGEFTAGDATYQYTDQTSVVISGTPGETGTLDLVDYLEPPILPELHFTMQRPPKFDGTVQDQMIGFNANAENLQLTAGGSGRYRWAYAFDGQSALTLDHDYFQSVTDFGVVLQAQLDGSQVSTSTLFDHPRSGLTLKINANNQIIWQQQTLEGTRQLISASVNGSWHEIGAHLVDSQLVLQVDGEIYRNDEVLTGEPSSSANIIEVGKDFAGKLSNLRIFDWDAEKIVQFADGSLEASYQISESGRALLSLRSGGANAFAHISEQRFLYQHKAHDGSILEYAYAQDDACATPEVGDQDEFDFGQQLSEAEALSKHLADCNYLPKIKKAFVTLRSDAGIIRKAIAVVELKVYTALYVKMKRTELALAIGPDCAQGIVVGSPTNLASGTCDFITSLLLVGDLRDFALHSYWLFTSEVLDLDTGKAKYNKATYIFASIGIITTLAEFTGAGIVVDAAVAGCKTVSKILGKNAYMSALAEKASTHILENWKDSAKLEVGFKVMLPTMQVTAMVMLLKDEMGKAWDVITGIEAHQLEGWLVYAKESLQLSVPAIATLEDRSLFELEIAYAAIGRADLLRYLDANGAAREFLQALQRAVTRLEGTGLSSNAIIVKAVNESASLLGKKVDDIKLSNEDLANAIAKSDVLSGFAVVFDVGHALGKTDELMEALTRIRCVPSNCHSLNLLKIAANGDSVKAMEGLFEKISDVSKLVADGKMSTKAYEQFSDVVKQLARESGKTGEAVIAVQRGAAHVVTEMASVARKIAGNTDDFVIEGFEVSVRFGANGKLGERFYDFTVRIAGKLHHVEMKAWDPTRFSQYMTNSLKGLKNPGDRLPGQMSKDLTQSLKDAGLFFNNAGELSIGRGGLDNIIKRWAFDSRMTEAGKDVAKLADEVADILKKDPQLARGLLVRAGLSPRRVENLSSEEIDIFLSGSLKLVLEKIFVI